MLITDLSIKRPVFASVLSLLLLAFGALSFFQLPLREYPDIDTVEKKLEVVSRLGYESVNHFVLPASSWTDLYYDPLAKRISECEQEWKGIPEAEDVLSEARTEISVFGKCSRYFSYAFFVMRR